MHGARSGGGKGEEGTRRNPNAVGKDGGKRARRARDRILQSRSEGFPPEYRTGLERYYRRLADEKTGSTSNAKAKGTGAPNISHPGSR